MIITRHLASKRSLKQGLVFLHYPASWISGDIDKHLSSWVYFNLCSKLDSYSRVTANGFGSRNFFFLVAFSWNSLPGNFPSLSCSSFIYFRGIYSRHCFSQQKYWNRFSNVRQSVVSIYRFFNTGCFPCTFPLCIPFMVNRCHFPLNLHLKHHTAKQVHGYFHFEETQASFIGM